MRKRLLCLLLGFSLCLSLSPAVAAAEGTEDVALTLTGVEGDTPYLCWGELTATVGDYLEAVRDVGNGLLLACDQADIPFLSAPQSLLELPGVYVKGEPHTYFWSNTISGVPFGTYLEEKSRVLAFYRSWEESDLAPVSTPEGLEEWMGQRPLHFQWFAQPEEEPVREAYALLSQGKEDEIPVEEYTSEPREVIPLVAQLLQETEPGVWTEPFYFKRGDGTESFWAIAKRLPVTAEEHRQALVWEVWPEVMEVIAPQLAEGAPELPGATELYEDWLNWAMAQKGEVEIATTRWTTLGEDADIAPGTRDGADSVYTLDFPDVHPGDWFAPAVQVCVENGIMLGTGEGRFEPHRELTVAETVVLGARFLARMEGEAIPHLPEDPFSMARFYAQDGTLLGDFRDRVQQPLSGVGSEYLTSFREEILAQTQGEPITLVVDAAVLEPYWDASISLWNRRYRFMDLSAPLTYEGVWDGECYQFDLGEDFDGDGPDFLIELSSFINLAAFLPEWYRDEFFYLSDMVGINEDFLAGHDLAQMTQAGWLSNEKAQRDDLVSILREARSGYGMALEAKDPDQYTLSLIDKLDNQELFVLRLYLAGVLTGVDGTGAYAGEKSLTRGECAAILARILEPGLRVDNTGLDYGAILGTE